MAYLGKAPVNGFHSKQQLTGDGSTVTFTLDYTVADETSMIVSVGGVLQEPKTAFDLAGGGTQITFTEAPASTDRVYIQFLGTAIVQNLLDVNGAEFILDANANTSFTADTDDEIDIKVGGTDRSTIKATGFHNVDSVKFVAGTGDDMQMYHDGTNSYLTNATGALKIATETSGIALTIGHTTSEVTFGDNVTITGTLTVGGAVSFGDFDITNVGSIALDTITNDGTDITLDSSGDIILDAGGDTIFLKDSGTTFGSLDNSSSNLIIKSGTTTALTFSGANVTAAGTIGSGAITSTGIVTGTAFTAGSAVLAEAELELLDGLTAGTAIASKVVTTDANIDSTGMRNLTISGTFSDGNYTFDTSGNVSGLGTIGSGNITSSGTVQGTTITATTAFVPDASGGADLGTTALEFNDAFFNDGAVINFGDDQDTTLTHTDGTGLTLNSTNKLCFNDASQFIQGASATVLDIAATDEIELTATLIDVVGNFTNSGTIVSAGVITAPSLVLGSTAVTTTPAELNLIDGGTARGTDAVADGDGILINDAGTMKMTTVQTVSTYMAAESVGGGNIVTTGALNSGSITSGFGTIDTGSSTITTTGLISGGSLDIDNVLINGTTIGHTDDTDLLTVADAALTLKGTFSVGVNDTGHDVKFHGATSGCKLFWDEDLDRLRVEGRTDGSAIFIVTDNSADILNVTSSGTVFNEDSGDRDFRVESNGNANMVFVDGGNDKVAIGTATATATLTVAGSAVAGTSTAGSQSGSTTLDFTANQNFVLTLTGNITLANPTTEAVGQSGFIVLIQDGTGSRTLAVGDQYFGPAGSVPTISTAANAVDIIPYVVMAAGKILLGEAQLAFADAS